MKLVLVLCCITATLWQADSFPTGTPPMFTATLEDMVIPNPALMGVSPSSFSIQCQVTGDPTPTIAWFREGSEIEGEASATLTVNPITGTDATESGVKYYCEANNSFGRIRSRTANVQLATFGDWTVSGANTTNARLGLRVAIPCTPPAANPPPIVFWQRNSVNITAGNPLAGGANDRVQVLPSGHLVIHQLEASDFSASSSDTYRCSVSNANTHTISMSLQTFTLNQVEMLDASPDQSALHVFNHDTSVGQAERGETFYIFNVVAPTQVGSIFSNIEPLTAVTKTQEFYIVNNVQVSIPRQLEVAYFFSASGSVQSLGSLTTNIDVIDPADVTEVSGPQRALTGRTVTLTCAIEALPAATVMWYKDGIAITPGGRIQIDTTADTNTQLTISSVTMADNGMYQCFVSNVHGDDVGTISLQVRDHELEISQALPMETPFLKGDNRSLTASVLSDTQPTMTWFVNGQAVTASNSTYQIGDIVAGSTSARGLTEYSRTLMVFSLNTTYEGEYRLVATVAFDGLSVETSGNVLQERLTNSVIVTAVDSPCLVVGNNATLRCQPNGVPRSTVTWFQNNRQLSTGTDYVISDGPDFTITIINVDQGDAGSFTCDAVNTLTNGTMSGTISGSVVFGIACVTPTISQVTDDTVDLSPTLVTGGTLTLTCTAMGTPRPQVNWFRGDTLINIDSRTQITRDPDGTSTLLSTLTISSTTTGDSGAYQCQVENAAGTTSLQYQVTVDPVAFPWWAIVVIAVGAVLIVAVFLVVCVVCCCLFRRSGTYEIGGKEETDNAEEEFNPLYASLPAQRPAQPPEYKQAPSYPSGTSLMRTPMHVSDMDNRFASLPPPDSTAGYIPHGYTKEPYPGDGRYGSHHEFPTTDGGQFV